MSGPADTFVQGFAVRGWCPGALRPMASGDGLVVRVRPRLGRFTQVQAAGIARASVRHGSGVIDFTSRANLQIRGVRADAHVALIGDLDAMGLVDASEALEARRNIVVNPFAGEDAEDIAQTVEAVLPDLPPLPGKFGFAVDCGGHRVLADVSADIRVERSSTGVLLLRADGMAAGWTVTPMTLADALRRLVAAFVDARGRQTTRMGEHLRGDERAEPALIAAMGAASSVPVPAMAAPEPGLHPAGAMIGFAFGQTDAATLAALADLGPIRVTPWRMLLVEGLREMPDLPDLITDPGDPLRRVIACTGAPGCPQGLAPTRSLAKALAAHVPRGKSLHVSGCAKGCAHPGIADVTLVATGAGFAPVRQGAARDASALPPIGAGTLLADPALIGGYF